MNLWLLFLVFFKIGAFTFGGGYAMLPMIRQEVLAHHWMSDAELINFIAVSESTPGSFAINVATYIGAHTAGIIGALLATAGVILPGFLIILLLAKSLTAFQKSQAVQGMLTGLRPAVVGLIASAALSVSASVFNCSQTMPVLSFKAGILVMSVYLLFHKRAHPIFLLFLAALIGISAGMLGILD